MNDIDKSVFSGGGADEEVEINLVELMVQLLLRWKKIALLALIFAFLLGAYKLITASKSQTVIDKEEASYQATLQAYEAQKQVLEDQIVTVSQSISNNSDYLESSMLMQLDPYNYSQATISYYVDAHYTVDPDATLWPQDPTYSLVGAYLTSLQQGDFYNYLSNISTLNEYFDSRDFSELISAQSTSVTGFITITVATSDLEYTQAIEQGILQYMESLQQTISEKIASHDLTLIASSSCWVRDEDLQSDKAGDVITASGNFVASKQDEFTKSQTDLSLQLADLKKQLSELTDPKEDRSSSSIQRQTIKFALIGFILGIVVACGFITLDFLFSDKFYDDEELKTRYGIFVLASLRRFPDKGCGKICAALVGDKARQADMPTLASLTTANVDAVLRSKGLDLQNTRVLVAGSQCHKYTELEAAINSMDTSITYTFCGDILTNPAAIDSLLPAACVVICEEKSAACRSTLLSELVKVSDLGCYLIGLVAL